LHYFSGMKNAEVSVLLPFYNPGVHFESALASVINHEDCAFELILVNNNSDPVSVEIASELERKFDHVKLYHENEQGIAFALNKGLTFCKSRYVARMDADDLMLPGRLKLQFDFLETNHHIGMVAGLVTTLNDVQGAEGMDFFTNQINELLTERSIYHHRFVESPFAHPSVMYRKSLIDAFGHYNSSGIPEDYELWLRWFSHGIVMSKIPHEVLLWRDHGNRLSRNHPDYSRTAFNHIRYRYLVQWIKSKPDQTKPVWIWGGGKFSKKNAKVLTENGITVAGFIDIFPERKIPGFEVLHYSQIPPPGEIFIVSMISNRGKNKEVEQYLLDRGYQPDRDYILAG